LGDENTVYSVRLRQGLDVAHYDMVFTEKGLVLRYLGEYWEKSRPVTGLQRAMDLHVYRLRKRRARAQGGSKELLIGYEEIRGYQLIPPRTRRRWRRIAGRKVLHEEQEQPKLVLELRDGRRLVIEFSPRIYELVKALVKKYLAPASRKQPPGAPRWRND
jgi:hypothetical protein